MAKIAKFQLRGNSSKIASIIPNLFPQGTSMQNLRSLACPVWAVGGVVRKSVCAFYIRRKSVEYRHASCRRGLARTHPWPAGPCFNRFSNTLIFYFLWLLLLLFLLLLKSTTSIPFFVLYFLTFVDHFHYL